MHHSINFAVLLFFLSENAYLSLLSNGKPLFKRFVVCQYFRTDEPYPSASQVLRDHFKGFCKMHCPLQVAWRIQMTVWKYCKGMEYNLVIFVFDFCILLFCCKLVSISINLQLNWNRKDNCSFISHNATNKEAFIRLILYFYCALIASEANNFVAMALVS